MRGKVDESGHENVEVRITPAYAGKSRIPSSVPTRSGDHPRVCGEKFYELEQAAGVTGSPPRMRGKGVWGCSREENSRITPAYAGKSTTAGRGRMPSRDHPRVCGEKPQMYAPKKWMKGSPPRMRGKAFWQSGEHQLRGITPAYAGKSARRQAGPPGPAPPPQMRLGWSPPPCTGRRCRTRKSTHARRARIPAPAHTPAPQ